MVLLLLLTSCASQNPFTNVPLESTGKVSGFLEGLEDGALSGWALFSNVFMDEENGIYEVHNDGNNYNFGFLLGLGALGFAASESTKKSRK